VSRNIKILWRVNSYAAAHAVRGGKTKKRHERSFWQVKIMKIKK
jgi:hypothetical protein